MLIQHTNGRIRTRLDQHYQAMQEELTNLYEEAEHTLGKDNVSYEEVGHGIMVVIPGPIRVVQALPLLINLDHFCDEYGASMNVLYADHATLLKITLPIYETEAN